MGLLNSNNISEGQGVVSDFEISITLQQDDYSCAPYCIKMILDYLSQIYDSIPNIEPNEIAECIGTTEMGTPSGSNLDNINGLLTRCVPSIEFYRDTSHPRWASIVKDLSGNKPTILWILCEDAAGRYFEHSVVVTGYKNRRVIYIDPIYGRREESVDTFLEKWEDVDRFAIRLRVGERIERKLTEYILNGNEGVEDE